MRRTIAAVGLVGIGLLGTTLPAIGAPDGQVTVCHQTGSETNPEFEIGVNEEAVENGNSDNGNGNGNGNGPGNNGNGVGLEGECTQDNEQPPNEEPPAEEPPAEEPPAEEPPAEEPPAEVQPPAVAPPVMAPPAVVVPAAPAVKPVAKPAAAAPAAVAPVAAVPVAAPAATNAGYNVQTAAGGGTGSGVPAWLAAVTALFTGLSAVVVVRGGARARKLRG